MSGPADLSTQKTGPSWHLAVLPLIGRRDGSLPEQLSHTVADGQGFLQAIADAANGNTRYLGVSHRLFANTAGEL